jgi:hypothetical protein
LCKNPGAEYLNIGPFNSVRPWFLVQLCSTYTVVGIFAHAGVPSVSGIPTVVTFAVGDYPALADARRRENEEKGEGWGGGRGGMGGGGRGGKEGGREGRGKRTGKEGREGG